MKKLQKDLRSTHYILGTDEAKDNYTSMAAKTFIKPENAEKATLSKET
jgi:hypothetical protein